MQARVGGGGLELVGELLALSCFEVGYDVELGVESTRSQLLCDVVSKKEKESSYS